MLRKIYSNFTWFFYRIHRKLKSKLSIVKRIIVKPALPNNPDGKILIHLGCGDVNSPEFINVDCRPASHIHYVCAANDLSIFPDNYADMVYACHILEHIPHNNIKKILWEWRRVLKPNGVLRVAVPDFDKILTIYESSLRDITSIEGVLMGGQSYEFNFHYCIFNRKYLTEKLREVGFSGIHEWSPDNVSYHDFRDTANYTVFVEDKEFPVSLNIEAIK